ncbi:MAG: recombination protein RecR, partial [Candidatus Omnitrophica bacterium]|nr:recombination protein RecR [Candidatus Omnitrophota bacterium]
MAVYTKSIERLIKELSRLPGIGPRSAERIAFSILTSKKIDADGLSEAIKDVKHKTSYCKTCFNLAEGDVCAICGDSGRDRLTICVVEKTADALAIERSHEHRGLYHVLGGKLSPLDGIGPDQLRIKELIKRAASSEIKEIILALSSDTEGETTALYLIRVFDRNKIKAKITRLAYGLPVGGDIEFVDEVT